MFGLTTETGGGLCWLRNEPVGSIKDSDALTNRLTACHLYMYDSAA